MKLSVVILAAGAGTRFNSRKSKVLHDVGGKPMLGHVLDGARALSPAEIHVVVGDNAAAVRAAIGDDAIRWHEQHERLGTAHALQCARAALGGDNRVLVLYGDVMFINPDTLKSLLAALDNADLAILTRKLHDPAGYGRIVRSDSGEIMRIVEERDATPREAAIREINTGIIAARGGCLPDLLERIGCDNAQGEYYLTDCAELAIKRGLKVATRTTGDPDEGRGINTPGELEAAERCVQLAHARQLLAQGVILRDAKRLDVRGEVSAGRDVVIDVNVVLAGRVELGDDVRIGANCVLRDASLGNGTTVEPFSIVESSRTGRNCTIGPFARIRPETELADRVKVGNFVEVKKSTVGAGSKINHLSYLGDSTLGRGVNVGAGTITCNYDGAQKHRTLIGDDVFVGSGTQIVAPVKIGDGATIGAGSTITRDAGAGALTLSRSEQKTVPGWRRPSNKGKQ